MATITVDYTVGVRTPAGWRSVDVRAEVEMTSAKMGVVKEIILVDGEIPHYGQSRTGAKRQTFNGLFVAKNEIGAKKRLSACTIVSESAA